MTQSLPTYDTVVVTNTISQDARDKLAKVFKTVYYRPDNVIPPEELALAEVFFTNYSGFPKGVTLDQIPNAKVLQLSSAGAGHALAHPILKSAEGRKQITISSASGIHSYSIPQYIVAQTINLYMRIHTQVLVVNSLKRWPDRRTELSTGPLAHGVHEGNWSLTGRTAGLLGYGHIGRETARLFKAFNVNVIAANSSGTKREDNGYIIPGTGDKDGSIPSKYYSTNDRESFKEFLSKSDILIASLPSTPQTTYLLTAEHFKTLPKNAIFINVGRGDLAHSDDILGALEHHLAGVALDVTDPEPLPDKHPLFSHPKAIITPHTSGDFEGYFDAGADLLIANIEGARRGEALLNVIDPEKGY
ncbi:hypothetical protein P7C73_g6079, partial [Tremellales sp. Uapishka_1]